MRILFPTLALLVGCSATDPDPAGADVPESTREQQDQAACYEDFDTCYAAAETLEEQDTCEYALEDCIDATGGRPSPEPVPCDEQLATCLNEGYDPDECEEEAAMCRENQPT